MRVTSHLHEIFINHGSRLCCEIPISGGRVFEEGDEILLKDNANKGILISDLLMGLSILTGGNLSSCFSQVPIIVVFTKYDALVRAKKRLLAPTLGMDQDQWVHQSEEAAVGDIKLKCEKPLIAVAGNRHAWTQVSSMCCWLSDVHSCADVVVFPARKEYKDTIEKLIDFTMNSIVSVPAEAVLPSTQTSIGVGTFDAGNPNIGQWLFGSAQRGSVGMKIITSIE